MSYVELAKHFYKLVWIAFFVKWHIKCHRFFDAQTILIEQLQEYYLTNSRRGLEVHAFPKLINQKLCRYISKSIYKTIFADFTPSKIVYAIWWSKEKLFEINL